MHGSPATDRRDASAPSPTTSSERADQFTDHEDFLARARAATGARFSLAGRTPQSLQRLLDAWHAELGLRHQTGRSWAPSGMSGLHDFGAGDPDAPATHWHVEALLHSGALLAEGRTLRHCVASYEWRCIRGAASIWSLRHRGANGEARPIYTLEVGPRTRTIVQIRGQRNRRATGHPRRIASRTCEARPAGGDRITIIY